MAQVKQRFLVFYVATFKNLQAMFQSWEIKPGSVKTFRKTSRFAARCTIRPKILNCSPIKVLCEITMGSAAKLVYLKQSARSPWSVLAKHYTKNRKSYHMACVKELGIAQALIGSPEIVMLDEATAGLDPLHAREVREIVAELAKDITFILSSHDLSELERLWLSKFYI